MTHIPLRMCIACRQMMPQRELIRFVYNKETDEIKPDPEKKLFGRGAYICKNGECIKKAEKRNGLSRHFKHAVPAELYREAEKML